MPRWCRYKRGRAVFHGWLVGALFAATFLLNLGCAPRQPTERGLCPYPACAR